MMDKPVLEVDASRAAAVLLLWKYLTIIHTFLRTPMTLTYMYIIETQIQHSHVQDMIRFIPISFSAITMFEILSLVIA